MAAKKLYRLEDSMGYRLTVLAGEMKAQMRRRVSKFGITTQQCAVLMVLYRREGLNVTELAERIGVDFGGTSRLVDRLRVKGLLSGRTDGTDRRALRLELTRKGREVAPKALAASKAMNEVYLKKITQKEARQFEAILEKLRGGAAPTESKPWTKGSGFVGVPA